LKTYDGHHLYRIAMPLGGIGTGTVSLGGRGDLRDWEVMNRPAKGFVPRSETGPRSHAPFFALNLADANGPPVTRCLEGPLDPAEYEGSHGSPAANHGLPRFRCAEFAAAYPLGQVTLSDPEVPVTVRLEAFNPLIPGDVDRSSLPAAVLRCVLYNPAGREMTASICGSVPNFIGTDGSEAAPAPAYERRNRNAYRTGPDLKGLFMSSDGVEPRHPAWGTLALAVCREDDVSYRTAWPARSWGHALLHFWDDFRADGALDEPADDPDATTPTASLAARVPLPPGATRAVTFLLTWHFPNRQSWTPVEPDQQAAGERAGLDDRADVNRIGNYYTTRFADAWDAAQRIAADLPALERDTLAFVRAFCDADLPEAAKEAALFNISTLRTQTCFRTPDGRFYGFEGCRDHVGCCLGSCTHVWNYEQATAFLFGDLARTMRDVEFAHATDGRGLMSFRVFLPLERATQAGIAAADGQMGCVMKAYRDWQLSGDDAFLADLWPHVRRAMAFCWTEGGWDADRDGVMEGCQHNTMDVEYYGPNPQMGTWYLGALRACEEMARHLGDDAFADTCRGLFERGRSWIDEHLFNGEYYEHEIRPPAGPQAVADGLYGREPRPDAILQLGAGCLVDQLVGQYMAHVLGLGYLLDPDHVRRTYESILRYNRRDTVHGHFNDGRTYALGDESALLMASYPRGRRPEQPFPYFTEVMTGFEYAAAVGMMQEGLVAEGLACIQSVRDRYDGRKRSPFNEAECGHHYARAMASWAAVTTLTGFHYSAVTGDMRFAASHRPATWFWSTGYAWGTLRQDRKDIKLTVARGPVRLKRLIVGDRELPIRTDRPLAAGDTVPRDA
jgi:uncharacterized protein (DUF608 family)